MSDDLSAGLPAPISDDLVDRYAGGECTLADSARVESWIADDPEPPARRRRVDALRAVWDGSRALPERWDVDAAWRATAPRVISGGEPARSPHLAHASTPERVRRPVERAPVGGRSVARWAAAGVCVAVIVAGVLWRGVAERRGTAIGMAPGKVFTTARGERAVVRLADGTTVTLAPASQLREDANYNGRSRTVDLDGEALFDVVHDAARPFTVQAGQAVIRDVGTRFVVDAYRDRPSVLVAVAAGRVAVSVAQSAHAPLSTLPLTELMPGDRAVVADARVRAVDRGVDMGALMGWVDGEVRMRDTPLVDIAASLSRWYDVDVRVADPALGARRVSVSFGHEQLDDVLDGLAGALDASWERHVGSVVLTARTPTPLPR